MHVLGRPLVLADQILESHLDDFALAFSMRAANSILVLLF